MKIEKIAELRELGLFPLKATCTQAKTPTMLAGISLKHTGEGSSRTCTVVGTGVKCLTCGPGSESRKKRTELEKECTDNRYHGGIFFFFNVFPGSGATYTSAYPLFPDLHTACQNTKH